MYSTKAQRTFIELYEAATEKLASAYPVSQVELPTTREEEQSNETATKR